MSTPVESEPLREPLLPSSEDEQAVQSEVVTLEEEVAPILQDEEVVEEAFQGQVQPPAYRDVWFAGLFLLQVAVMVATAGWSAYYLGTRQFSNDNVSPTPAPTSAPISNQTMNWLPSASKDDPLGIHDAIPWIIGLVIVGVGCAMVACSLFLVVLQRYSRMAVEISFFTAPVCNILAALLVAIGDFEASLPVWGSALFLSLTTAIHYFCVRRYIPFTAANIRCGAEALEKSKALFGYAVWLQILSVVYWAVSLLALMGLSVYFTDQEVPCPETEDGDNSDEGTCHGSVPGWILCLWILAVCWAQGTVHNVLVVTTSGAIGNWWFRSPDEEEDSVSERRSSCCCPGQPDVHDSWHRATTYSFGSVCLGSLVQAIVRLLEWLVKRARNRRERELENGGIWLCVLEFIIQWIVRLVEYFNSWAFLYVGLYGYNYLDAGRNVVKLLKERGFAFVITDRLLYQVLGYIKLSIGLVSGALLALLAAVLFKSHDEALLVIFLVGLLLGFIMATLTLSVAESSIRTIMLCFIERPMDGAAHRPQAYQTLTNGWSAVYPENFPARQAPAAGIAPLTSTV